MQAGHETSSSQKLKPIDELFLALYQLRCNVLVKDLRYQFFLHPNFVLQILTAWINFLYKQTCCPTKITLQQKSFLLNQTHVQAFYLSRLVFQLSKSKQNTKMVLMRFAFPINAHQKKANWKCAFIQDAVYTSTSLVPRPCAFVACSMKFTQRTWARSSHDVCHSLRHGHFTENQ